MEPRSGIWYFNKSWPWIARKLLRPKWWNTWWGFYVRGGRVKINATVVFDTIPSISNIYVTITGPDAIPDSMITDQLVTLYKNGATPRLMTGIAMQESSYMQFRNFTLFNRADKWPNESYDGGSHIGLMMVVPNLTRAWNWFNNTNEGVNLFVNQKLAFSRTYVNRKILEQSKIGITLRDWRLLSMRTMH